MNTLIVIGIIACFVWISGFKSGRSKGQADNIAKVVSSLIERR